MRAETLLKSLLNGGPLAYVLSTLIITQLCITTVNFMTHQESDRESFFSHIRIAIVIILILINGLDNSSFIILIFKRELRHGVFICWSLHSISFLAFFLNILKTEELMLTYNTVDFVYRLVFYGVLISNSLFFLFFIILMIILSVLVLFVPRLRNSFVMLERFNDIFVMEPPENPINRPLQEHELSELHSIDYERRSAESICAICLDEKATGIRVLEAPECNHRFHSDCLKQWYQNRPNCPICKRNIREILNNRAN